MNGKLVVGANKNDLTRLLAVAPDAAQIVVLRKGESLAALRTLRSDNLRLTHRIGYLEEQVRDLLAPTRAELCAADLSLTGQEHVQVDFKNRLTIRRALRYVYHRRKIMFSLGFFRSIIFVGFSKGSSGDGASSQFARS